MAWRRTGDKPLFEPIMVWSLTQICVTRPQRVNLYRAGFFSKHENTYVFYHVSPQNMAQVHDISFGGRQGITYLTHLRDKNRWLWHNQFWPGLHEMIAGINHGWVCAVDINSQVCYLAALGDHRATIRSPVIFKGVNRALPNGVLSFWLHIPNLCTQNVSTTCSWCLFMHCSIFGWLLRQRCAQRLCKGLPTFCMYPLPHCFLLVFVFCLINIVSSSSSKVFCDMINHIGENI